MVLPKNIIDRKKEKKRIKRLKRRKIALKRWKSSTNRQVLEHKINDILSSRDIDHIVKNWNPDFVKFFDKESMNFMVCSESHISMPVTFCFRKNYNESFRALLSVINSLSSPLISLTEIDFTKCKYANPATLFVLYTVIKEINEATESFNKGLNIYKIKSDYKSIGSVDGEVNIRLMLSFLLTSPIKIPELDIKEISILKPFFGKQKQKQYYENKKGKVTTDVVGFVNDCIGKHDFEFNPQGRNQMERLIAEVLNNAEDHSLYKNWAVGACFLNIKNDEKFVGELNIYILNYGFSFLEGFEKTKVENSDMYDIVHNKVEENYKRFDKKFTKENLFTLYSLQEGISRLKFESDSRGTGTMTFLRAFLELGGYEDEDKDRKPSLSILSGNTQLICDNKYMPRTVVVAADEEHGLPQTERYVFALNDENDLNLKPDSRYLMNMGKYFPGTLISVRVFITPDYLDNVVNGKEN